MLRKFMMVMAMMVSSPALAAELTDGLAQPYPAPAIEGIKDWINSEPLKLENLKGKVVLIDFWAYSCVNCVRTLPHLIEWDKQYRDKGLVIIGVHAPEFDFEKDKANVKHAVDKWHVTYPVALDNDQVTWNNFKNQYWPAEYLIDKEGNIVYTHFGEGNYDITENNIRSLLGLTGMAKTSADSGMQAANQTPETYLGYARTERFDATKVTQDETAEYRYPQMPLAKDHWALSGMWKISAEKITASETGAALKLNFTSRKVFLVLGSESGELISASVTLNGKPIGSSAGKDIKKDGRLMVDHHTLYEIVAQPETMNNTLEITTADNGLEAYAFTFGN